MNKEIAGQLERLWASGGAFMLNLRGGRSYWCERIDMLKTGAGGHQVTAQTKYGDLSFSEADVVSIEEKLAAR